MGDRRAEHQFARNSQILRDGGVELGMPCSSFQTHSSGKKARVAGPLADFTPDGCKIRIEEDACLLLHWHVPAVPRKLKPNPRGTGTMRQPLKEAGELRAAVECLFLSSGPNPIPSACF